MAISKEELIRKYVRAIHDGNAAVFAGAGLSRPSGFVDWKGLLRPLASDIGLNVDKEHDLLSLAQFYKNKKGDGSSVSQEILNAFSKDVNLNDNIKILSRLPIYTYWTTNYDELLESGIREAHRKPDVKSDFKRLPITLHDRDAVVYKMHGDVNDPADAVLTKSDYEQYSSNYPMFRTVLESDIVSKTFLFIGFSFEDPNFDYILGQVHLLLGEEVREHFCFSKRVQESDYSDMEEYKYDYKKQDMQEDNLKRYGIQTVFVDSWDEITEILCDIEKAVKQKNVFISGSADEFETPWTKTIAEEFAGRLSAELIRCDCRITTGFGLGIGSSVVNGALDVIYNEKFQHVDENLRIRPFPQNIMDPKERKTRWKKYREDMLDETGISIFIFGNKKNSAGNIVEADGCIQEFEIAVDKGNIIIPVASTGYAARSIFNRVKADIDNYSYLKSYLGVLENETDVNKLIDAIKEIVRNQMIS